MRPAGPVHRVLASRALHGGPCSRQPNGGLTVIRRLTTSTAACALIAVAVLPGCSTQPYQGQVTAMAGGLNEVKRSFADMSEQERNAFIDVQIQTALKSGATFITPAN